MSSVLPANFAARLAALRAALPPHAIVADLPCFHFGDRERDAVHASRAIADLVRNPHTDRNVVRPVFYGKVRDDLHNHAHLANWSEMPDASSDALQFVAQEFEQVMEQNVEMIYGLANRLSDQSAGSGGIALGCAG